MLICVPNLCNVPLPAVLKIGRYPKLKRNLEELKVIGKGSNDFYTPLGWKSPT